MFALGDFIMRQGAATITTTDGRWELADAVLDFSPAEVPDLDPFADDGMVGVDGVIGGARCRAVMCILPKREGGCKGGAMHYDLISLSWTTPPPSQSPPDAP